MPFLDRGKIEPKTNINIVKNMIQFSLDNVRSLELDDGLRLILATFKSQEYLLDYIDKMPDELRARSEECLGNLLKLGDAKKWQDADSFAVMSEFRSILYDARPNRDLNFNNDVKYVNDLLLAFRNLIPIVLFDSFSRPPRGIESNPDIMHARPSGGGVSPAQNFMSKVGLSLIQVSTGVTDEMPYGRPFGATENMFPYLDELNKYFSKNNKHVPIFLRSAIDSINKNHYHWIHETPESMAKTITVIPRKAYNEEGSIPTVIFSLNGEKAKTGGRDVVWHEGASSALMGRIHVTEDSILPMAKNLESAEVNRIAIRSFLSTSDTLKPQFDKLITICHRQNKEREIAAQKTQDIFDDALREDLLNPDAGSGAKDLPDEAGNGGGKKPKKPRPEQPIPERDYVQELDTELKNADDAFIEEMGINREALDFDNPNVPQGRPRGGANRNPPVAIDKDSGYIILQGRINGLRAVLPDSIDEHLRNSILKSLEFDTMTGNNWHAPVWGQTDEDSEFGVAFVTVDRHSVVCGSVHIIGGERVIIFGDFATKLPARHSTASLSKRAYGNIFKNINKLNIKMLKTPKNSPFSCRIEG